MNVESKLKRMTIENKAGVKIVIDESLKGSFVGKGWTVSTPDKKQPKGGTK